MRSAANQAGRRPKTRGVYSCHSPTFQSILEAVMSRLQSRIFNKHCVQEVFKGVPGSGKTMMKAPIVMQKGRTSNLGVDLYSISELFPPRPSFQNFMIITEVRRLKDVKRGKKPPFYRNYSKCLILPEQPVHTFPKPDLLKYHKAAPKQASFKMQIR